MSMNGFRCGARFGFLAALVLCLGAAHAEVKDFYGHWENPVRDAGGLTHIVISPGGGNRVNVRAYGNCHPIECNWGQAEGKSHVAGPRPGDVDSISVVFDAGLARRRIVFRLAGKHRLGFRMQVEYRKGTGRHDFSVQGRLRPTAWAGPIAGNWERPAATGTGWGGGVLSGASPVPREHCVPFRPSAVRTVMRGGKWVVLAGSQRLAESADKRLAMKAEATIRYYGFDRKCAVDGATTYWKRGGSVPGRKMGGGDCLMFNATTAHEAHIGQGWKVVDGPKWIADFGHEKHRASALLSLIRTYHLNARCVVGWPDIAMTYWLSLDKD